MDIEQLLLERAYDAFNGRDIDTALALMHSDVDWPNGMEGGSVHGHDAVRDYWTRQWGLIDPHVDPVGFTREEDGRLAVEVHQMVRDLGGAIMQDVMIRHLYRIEGGLIRSMEIQAPFPDGDLIVESA